MGIEVERRQAKRVFRESLVQCAAFGFVAGEVGQTTFTGLCTDVSEDGRSFGLEAQQPLYPGQMLRLVQDDVVQVAVVRWVSSAPIGYRAGVLIV